VNVVVFAVHLDQLGLEVGADFLKDQLKPLDRIRIKDPITILGDEDQVNMKLKYTVSSVSNVTCAEHRPSVF
jgi:hypothetical protein